jgi:transcription elongation factor Elf1
MQTNTGVDMTCPVCGSDNVKIPWSDKRHDADIRTHLCVDCGCRFRSRAVIMDVYVFNPDKLKEERIPIEKFDDKYLDFKLHRGKHPTAQQSLNFNENGTGTNSDKRNDPAISKSGSNSGADQRRSVADIVREQYS